MWKVGITNRTRLIESISGVFPHLERRIYTSFLFHQRTLATIDIPYRARIMNRTRFVESISGAFSTFRTKNIHIWSVLARATLSTIDIPYRARIMNSTRFIEIISGVFPHLERRIIYTVISCLFVPVHSQLERRIYTCLVCFCQRTLATIDIPFRARILRTARVL